MVTTCQTVVVENVGGPASTRSQNYPNPFNPNTNICFELPSATHVNLSIYNVLGQKVATLQDVVMTAGEHIVEWGGTDDAGKPLASGVYFYRLETEEAFETKKMLMVR